MAQLHFTLDYDFFVGLFSETKEAAFGKLMESLLNQVLSLNRPNSWVLKIMKGPVIDPTIETVSEHALSRRESVRLNEKYHVIEMCHLKPLSLRITKERNRRLSQQ